MIGQELNHYRITHALGRGGMGEVYEAEDTRLRRRVALKVLAENVAADRERHERFEREARVVAALNHPNIVTLYSIERAGDRLFLTMELVQGKTLARMIPAGGLPLDRLLALAIPLADALSAAHRQGVVHRDFKPENVMVTDDGRVKILDFGLAQLMDLRLDGSALTTMQQLPLTGEGRIVGTVAYMSPEQAQGMDVDARSDVFALGIVLYEAATGERPFKGESAIAILSSIVKDAAPALNAVNPAVPEELARIVRRCLAKDATRRYQTATDVRNDLEDLQQRRGSGPSVPVTPDQPESSRRWREAVAWSIAGVSLVTALGAVFGLSPASAPVTEVYSVLPPERTTLTEGEAPQVSPDGKLLAFVATDESGRTLLYVRDRGGLAARALEETDDATQPFWSPDSRFIGYFAGGALKKVAVAGGRPQTLASAPVPRGGTWSAADVIVFVPFPELPPHRVNANGGTATALPIDEQARRWLPSFLPDGRHYVYLAFARGRAVSGVYLGSIDGPEATLLVASSTGAAYVDSGFLLFRREASLVAQGLNAAARRLEGTPVVLADAVSFNPVTQQMLASASGNGILAYLSAGQSWQLTWFDRSGRRLTQPGVIGGYNSLCLSGDGRHVVYDVADPRTGNVDLYSMELATGVALRQTFHPAADFYPACAPAADEVVFASPRAGTPNLHRLVLSSPGNETALEQSPLPILPTQWSRDGRLLLFTAFSVQTDFDVWMVPVGGGQPTPIVATEAAEKGGQLSWDGRWIAYSSGQYGADEVFVQAFPPTGALWQISKGGGRQPQWAPDGKQLFYISRDKRLMAVDVDGSGPRFVSSASRVLVDTRVGGWERTYLGNPYAVSGDGRLLVANAKEETLPVTVMLNWRSRLQDGQE